MCARHDGNAQAAFEQGPGNAGTAPHRRLNTHLTKEMHPAYGHTHTRETHRCTGVCVRTVTAVSPFCAVPPAPQPVVQSPQAAQIRGRHVRTITA